MGDVCTKVTNDESATEAIKVETQLFRKKFYEEFKEKVKRKSTLGIRTNIVKNILDSDEEKNDSEVNNQNIPLTTKNKANDVDFELKKDVEENEDAKSDSTTKFKGKKKRFK